MQIKPVGKTLILEKEEQTTEKSTGNTASGRSLTLALKWNMKRKVAKQRFCRNWEYPPPSRQCK